ncbi:MAG: translation elongation factor Ts [Candidatus Nealsonbacteria bacterium CG08_land_8_20_14_0_20_43_11]|uniref:Elongation factor Ts n=1 Tax=Candidatus Nealsonbacteria bacterium CG08_land_8_20_14_0_20_43_11 TaxID=1974706 RepID=A0A2M6T1Z6_9BACT|nr:MAG: translation elongation factor Ts [Candidatus Nealsonbacteria bacterium CG08_land_8_20_14_0_20_43_11]
MLDIEKLKQLRGETSVSLAECRKALIVANNDLEKAKEILRQWGRELAAKKAERVVGQGIIDSYIHPNKKVGVLLDLRCETDFVARSEDFRNLAHELCLQIAAMAPTKEDFSSQPWIKDAARTVKDLINECIAKMGENVKVERFERFEL